MSKRLTDRNISIRTTIAAEVSCDYPLVANTWTRSMLPLPQDQVLRESYNPSYGARPSESLMLVCWCSLWLTLSSACCLQCAVSVSHFVTAMNPVFGSCWASSSRESPPPFCAVDKYIATEISKLIIAGRLGDNQDVLGKSTLVWDLSTTVR